MEITLQLVFCLSIFYIFFYVRIKLEMIFLQQHIFITLGLGFICGLFTFLMKITLQLRCYVSFLFVIMNYFLLRRKNVIYLFDVVTFFMMLNYALK